MAEAGDNGRGRPRGSPKDALNLRIGSEAKKRLLMYAVATDRTASDLVEEWVLGHLPAYRVAMQAATDTEESR